MQFVDDYVCAVPNQNKEIYKKVMEDPRMNIVLDPRPFDGKRMIYGGFQMIVNE